MAQRLTGLASFHWPLDVAPEKLVCKSFEAHGLLHKPGSWLQNPESPHCRPGQVQGHLVSPSPYSPCRPGGLALAGGSRLQQAEQGSLLTASSAQLATCCLVTPPTAHQPLEDFRKKSPILPVSLSSAGQWFGYHCLWRQTQKLPRPLLPPPLGPHGSLTGPWHSVHGGLCVAVPLPSPPSGHHLRTEPLAPWRTPLAPSSDLSGATKHTWAWPAQERPSRAAPFLFTAFD